MRLALMSSRQIDSLNTNAFDSRIQPSAPLVREPSFEELFVEYQPLVYGVGLKFTGNPEDAEDIAQEVFTKVWRKLRSFNYNSSIKTWIYRIALNTCIDYSRNPWRKLTHRRPGFDVITEEREDERLTTDEENAERKLLSVEKAAQVRKAIARLKPHLKSVLVLKDLEEMSYQEISSVLGLSLGTISSRLNRARKALQEILESSWPALLEES
jgi:RNA polymerase sigma-70 factor (ECF subfamily)